MTYDWKFWIKRKYNYRKRFEIQEYIKHYNKTGNQKNVWIVIEKLEKGMDLWLKILKRGIDYD